MAGRSNGEPRPRVDRSKADLSPRAFWALALLVGLIGLALRVIDLTEIPPGLHFDQAANGLLALEILRGSARPVFFPSYTGREALFMYVIAGLAGLLGPGVLAIRLASALAGAATVVALAALGAALYGRRVGILSATYLAGLYWHLHVSRLGERTILVPLLDVLALLFLWRAFAGGRRPETGARNPETGALPSPGPARGGGREGAVTAPGRSRMPLRIADEGLAGSSATPVGISAALPAPGRDRGRGIHRPARWQTSLLCAALGGGLVGLQLYTYPSSRFFVAVVAGLGVIEIGQWLGRVAFGGWRAAEPGRSRPADYAPVRHPDAAGRAAPGDRASRENSRPPDAMDRAEPLGQGPAREVASSLDSPHPPSPILRSLALGLVVAIAALVVSTPLAVHFLRVPEDFLGRASQVAIWNPAATPSSVPATLANSVEKTLGMFLLEGDHDWKYNLAGRPVFDPVSGGFFLIGTLVALAGRRRPADRLTLLWLLGMLAPGFLSVDAPQFMRTLGAAPPATLLAARGLTVVVGWLGGELPHPRAPSPLRWRGGSYAPPSAELSDLRFSPPHCDGEGRGVRQSRWPGVRQLQSEGETARADDGADPRAERAGWRNVAGRLAPLLLAWPIVAGGIAVYQYFGVWGPSWAAYYALEGDVTDAAQLIRAEAPRYDTTYVASRYGANPTISYLVGEVFGRLRWFDGRVALPLPPPGAGPTLYVLPRTATAEYWYGYLPPSDRLRAVPGPDGADAVVAFTRQPDAGTPPAGQLADAIGYGGVARLIGAEIPRATQAGLPMAPLLTWRLERPPSEPLKFFVHLIDSAGQRWAQSDEEAYPTDQWQAGQGLLVRPPLEVPAYVPPGTYALEIGLARADGTALSASDAAGRSIGSFWRSPTFAVIRPERPPTLESLDLGHRFAVPFGGVARLVGARATTDQLQDGDTLGITLTWQVLATPPGGLVTTLAAVDERGATVYTSARPTTGGVWPAQDWRAGDVVVDRQPFLIPAGTPPGRLTMAVGLRGADQRPLPPAVAGIGESLAQTAVATLTVTARPRAAAAPIEQRQEASFAGGLRLLGYDLEPTAARPGQTVRLRLVWQADHPPTTGWTVFTHLLDAQEKIWAQQDSLPAGGIRPTTTWAPGEAIEDAHELLIQPDAPPGTYRLEVGLYDASNGERLRTTDGLDRVLLDQPVTVGQ